ncbi:MAG: retron system putative HNH endonuclease [Roseburia sp.]
MRRVIRGKQPDSLKNHAVQWTKELLAEIKREGCYEKVEVSYKNKYNQTDVKDALRVMYKNHCCYCEGLLGVQTYGRIEHLRPKSLPQFYDKTFDWNNLHWCCEICNTSYKKARWDDAAPILDPTADDIQQFLMFNPDTGEYDAIGDNERAKTTIDHTGMNRDKLVEARRRMVIRLVREYQNAEPVKKAQFLDEVMKTREEDSYPSVVETVVSELRN